METIFFHFIRQQSTFDGGNCSFFKWNIFSVNPLFWLVETIFLSIGNSIVLFRVFFCKWKLFLKLEGSQFLKTKYIPVSEHQAFFMFSETWRFFKVEATFPNSGSTFFIKSLTQLMETNFLSSGNSVFWSELIFC